MTSSAGTKSGAPGPWTIVMVPGQGWKLLGWWDESNAALGKWERRELVDEQWCRRDQAAKTREETIAELAEFVRSAAGQIRTTSKEQACTDLALAIEREFGVAAGGRGDSD